MDSGFRIPVFRSDRRNGSGFRISFRLIDSFSHLILVRAVIRNSVRTMQYFGFSNAESDPYFNVGEKVKYSKLRI